MYKLFIYFLVMIFPVILSSQSNIVSIASERVHALENISITGFVSADNNYYLAGTSSDPDNHYGKLVKLDQYLDQAWSKNTQVGTTIFSNVLKHPHSDYVYYFVSPYYGDSTVCLIRSDYNGNAVCIKEFTSTSIWTADINSEYIIAANFGSNNLIRIFDLNGNQVDSFAANDNYFGINSIIIDSNNNIYVSGIVPGSGNINYDAMIRKFSYSNGSWSLDKEKLFDDFNRTYLTIDDQEKLYMASNELTVLTVVDTFNVYGFIINTSKLDDNLEPVWTKNKSGDKGRGSSWVNGVEFKDGKLVSFGLTYEEDNTHQDALGVCYDLEGNELFIVKENYGGLYEAFLGVEAENNNFTFIGYSKQFNTNYKINYISTFDYVTAIEDPLPTPTEFALKQNYPNPFNPTTTIEYVLPTADIITLTVSNILGQTVATIVDNEFQSAGSHQVKFHGGNLPSGIYFYKIQGKSFSGVKRMHLIR